MQINEIPLSKVGNKCDEMSTKFIGIHIDENLRKRHISQLNSKSQELVLRRLIK